MRRCLRKTEASRPRNSGFRAQCEFMAWATRGPFPETRIYLDGCFRVLADRDKLHQAVKPLALMEPLVTVAPAGGLVVDPFVGSGSTCIAALRSGRRVIGIEINAEWAEPARERVRADLSGSDYGARASGQRALFGATDEPVRRCSSLSFRDGIHSLAKEERGR